MGQPDPSRTAGCFRLMKGWSHVKKIMALLGTEQRRTTYESVLEFEEQLKTLGEVDFEIVFLNDYRLEFCRGCKLCFDKGELFCPLKDDRDVLIDKLQLSDGVIFATPNYSFHVSARMKNLFDRLAFIFHRPRFFDKTCTAIVTQGIYGGAAILKYLTITGENFGFSSVKGCVLKTMEPITEKARRRNSEEIKKAAARFHKALGRSSRSPSFFRLMLFRMTRTGVRLMAEGLYDHAYYSERGWFYSDYYCEVKMGLFKKTLGRLFDVMGRLMSNQS